MLLLPSAFGGRRGPAPLLLLLLVLMLLVQGAGAITGAKPAAAACAPGLQLLQHKEQQEPRDHNRSDSPPGTACSVPVGAGAGAAAATSATMKRLRGELLEALRELQTAPRCARSPPASFALQQVIEALTAIDALPAATVAEQHAWLHAVAGMAGSLRTLHAELGGGVEDPEVLRIVAVEEEARAAAGGGVIPPQSFEVCMYVPVRHFPF